MTPTRNRMAGIVSTGALVALAFTFLMVVPNVGAATLSNAPMSNSVVLTPQPMPRPLLSSAEQMPAFLNGSVVNTIYLQGNFVGNKTGYNSSAGMEPLVGQVVLGATPNVFPTARASIHPFIALVPWWGPARQPYAPAYHPGTWGIQEMCAPATLAVCWDHPSQIVVPGLGNVPLPGHDHLIGTAQGFTDSWWNLEVVLVLNASYWPGLTGGQPNAITSFASLAAAQHAGAASANLGTNDFLNFAVATHQGGYTPTPPTPTRALLQYEQMPAFLNGKVVDTVYENGFFTDSNASRPAKFGGEPLLAEPGIGAPDVHDPIAPSQEPPFIVLVPWWGPSSAPYAPAYDPSAYGIQLMCAPETMSVCYDHPTTIDVPGLGVVPLPGHDHLITTTAHNTDTWWSLIVVLVFNASVFPNLSGTHGINSLASLQAAEAAGQASAQLDTNTYLNFEVAP
jgi:hypothetical protein